MTKVAFVTGITGQDGAYLGKFLLEKGYRVIAGRRRLSTANYWRLEYLDILKDLDLVYFDLTEDATGTIRILEKYNVSEFYNLAAQSFVDVSFDQPSHTNEINYIGLIKLLEAIRSVDKNIRFYQASSSEMYGKVVENPQSETTPFYPRSPYAVSKLAAHWITCNYRESHNLHASSGILFNHESPLRGEEFVTRKITSSLAQIKCGKLDTLHLGNLEALRDWGYAEDYVKGMWMMLQQEKPDDYVLATGKTCSVRMFCEKAAHLLGYSLAWKGTKDQEVGIDTKTGKTLIKVDPKLYRPAEVDTLCGNPSKARKILGWQHIADLDKLVEIMVEADIKRVQRL